MVNLSRAQFDNIEFPYTERTAKLSNRHHIHEFPRMAGGIVEKQGRKLWTFTFKVPFHSTNDLFPDLYPSRLQDLTERAERLQTGMLVVPGIGQIRAFITDMDRSLVAKSRSGEDVTLQFTEDDLTPFQKATKEATTASLTAAAQEIKARRDAAEGAAPEPFALEREKQKPQSSLFDLLDDALSMVAAVKDQAELYGNLFAAKLERVATLCKTISNTVDFLSEPEFHELARAVRAVWDAANDLRKDLLQKGPRLLVNYVVPATMPVASVAFALYGSSARGGEVLALNDIHNPFAIPAGTVLRIYSEAQEGR